jgi:hypothetical protein
MSGLANVGQYVERLSVYRTARYFPNLKIARHWPVSPFETHAASQAKN